MTGNCSSASPLIRPLSVETTRRSGAYHIHGENKATGMTSASRRIAERSPFKKNFTRIGERLDRESPGTDVFRFLVSSHPICWQCNDPVFLLSLLQPQPYTSCSSSSVSFTYCSLLFTLCQFVVSALVKKRTHSPLGLWVFFCIEHWVPLFCTSWPLDPKVK